MPCCDDAVGVLLKVLSKTTLAMVERGGYKQRLQQGGFALLRSSTATSSGEGEGARGKLAQKLLERWCWGAMSLPVLQELAAAGVEDGIADPFLRRLVFFFFLGGGGWAACNKIYVCL